MTMTRKEGVAVAQLAAQLADMQEQINDLSRAPQLDYSTVEVGGVSLPVGKSLAAGVEAGTIAEQALVSANGKNQSKYRDYEPDTVEGFSEGDNWFMENEAGTAYTRSWRLQDGAWVEFTIDGTALTNLDAGSITAGTLRAIDIEGVNIKSANMETVNLQGGQLDLIMPKVVIPGTDGYQAARLSVYRPTDDSFESHVIAANYGERATFFARGRPIEDLVYASASISANYFPESWPGTSLWLSGHQGQGGRLPTVAVGAAESRATEGFVDLKTTAATIGRLYTDYLEPAELNVGQRIGTSVKVLAGAVEWLRAVGSNAADRMARIENLVTGFGIRVLAQVVEFSDAVRSNRYQNLNGEISAPFAMAGGFQNFTNVAPNVTTTFTLNFGSRFTQRPIVTVTSTSSRFVAWYAPSGSGTAVLIAIRNTTDAASDVTVAWQAVQMTANNAAG